MKYFNNYHLPTTIDEALELLARYNGQARVIAGGTDLLVDLQSDSLEGGRARYAALVDVTRIEGANEIRLDGEWVVIGCGVTHTQIVESRIIQSRATALSEACSLVGGPQVRNVATLIGNVAHALPAADGTIALMSLGAEVQIASRVRANGMRANGGWANGRSPVQDWRPLGSVFLGPGVSGVDSTRELIAAIRFHPAGPDEASAFARIMRPQGVALPILAIGSRVKIRIQGAENRIEDVAICAGPLAAVPFRATKTEQFLRGGPFSKETVKRAAGILLSEAGLRTSPHRATREYRTELLPGLLEKTLQSAVGRAQGLDTRALSG